MGLNRRAAAFGRVLSSESFTVDATTAQALTVPAAAKSALVTVGGNAVRYRSDGTSPTSSVGHFAAANGNIEIFRDEMKAVEFISTTGSSDIFVTYYE